MRRVAAHRVRHAGTVALPPRVLPVMARGADAQPTRDGAGGRCASRSYRAAARLGAGALFVGGNVALYEYFRRAWWLGERADRFRVNWEQDQPFRQADEFGHALGG